VLGAGVAGWRVVGVGCKEGVACSGCRGFGCSVRGLLIARGWVPGVGGGCCVLWMQGD
jgi:hypothetical protein